MKHKNAWPKHVQGATKKFKWPDKDTLIHPCKEDRKVDVNFDPSTRPPNSPTARWEDVSHQRMWDFHYLVQEITKRLFEYSASIGTGDETRKLKDASDYIESPTLPDGTAMKIEEIVVEPSFGAAGGQQRILAVRIEGVLLIGNTTPAGYSSSSSSVNVYP